MAVFGHHEHEDKPDVDQRLDALEKQVKEMLAALDRAGIRPAEEAPAEIQQAEARKE